MNYLRIFVKSRLIRHRFIDIYGNIRTRTDLQFRLYRYKFKFNQRSTSEGLVFTLKMSALQVLFYLTKTEYSGLAIFLIIQKLFSVEIYLIINVFRSK